VNVRALREKLELLENEGRGDSVLYVGPTIELCNVSHRPGDGVVVGFDDADHPIEAVDDSFCALEDSAFIFLKFGPPDRCLTPESAEIG
jgi:hypothetical protein